MKPAGFSPIHLGVISPSVPFRSTSGRDSTGKDNASQAFGYHLQSSKDVLALPPNPMCIKGVLQDQGLVGLYGPSGSGKSFLALDVAVALVEGRGWFGYRVKGKQVVYVALEGESGIRNRVAAMEKSVGLPMPLGLRFLLGQPFNLTVAADVSQLADAIGAEIPEGGAVVFLDTLNRAAPGVDENASSDMGLILAGAKELQRLIGGLVVLVHHTGKDTSKGLRGHSSLLAALDTAIEVSRDGDQRQWRLAKSKDGEDGKAHAFKLKVIDLLPDADGDPVSSCVIEPDSNLLPKKAKAPQGGNQKLVIDAIRPMFAVGQVGMSGAPMTARCIDLEIAIAAGALKLSCDKSKRRERARTAITGMVTRGLLGLHGGWLWEI